MSDRASELIKYLQDHREELNIADISRKSGLSAAYLKHVVASRRSLSPHAEKRIRATLQGVVSAFPEGGDK